MGLLFGESWAAFSKLCGIRGNFKRFLGQRWMEDADSPPFVKCFFEGWAPFKVASKRGKP